MMVDGIYCLDRINPENPYFQAAAIGGHPNILTEEEALAFIASENDSGWSGEFNGHLDLYLSGIAPFDFLDWQEKADGFMEKTEASVNVHRWMSKKITGTVDSPWLLPFKMLAGVVVGVGSTTRGIVRGAQAGDTIGSMSGSKKITQAATSASVVGGAAVGLVQGLYYGGRTAFDTSSFLFESDPYDCFR